MSLISRRNRVQVTSTSAESEITPQFWEEGPSSGTPVPATHDCSMSVGEEEEAGTTLSTAEDISALSTDEADNLTMSMGWVPDDPGAKDSINNGALAGLRTQGSEPAQVMVPRPIPFDEFSQGRASNRSATFSRAFGRIWQAYDLLHHCAHPSHFSFDAVHGLRPDERAMRYKDGTFVGTRCLEISISRDGGLLPVEGAVRVRMKRINMAGFKYWRNNVNPPDVREEAYDLCWISPQGIEEVFMTHSEMVAAPDYQMMPTEA